jgi:TIR domain-containing protein
MARLFVSFVHEDEKVALAVQNLLQSELNLREEVFLSSDKSQVYAGDYWLQKIKEGLAAAELVILMLSKRSVARPWVNFEAGAAWLTDKTIIPVCYGDLSKGVLPHPYSAIQALNLPSEAYYLVQSVHHQLKLAPLGPDAVYRGTLFQGAQERNPEPSTSRSETKDPYEQLARALAEFKDD